ncbi:MAG: hypothetical protein Q7K03_09125 [Dehalococcoidia bacterium]|nr:hypothetical protein [Dehalococcoidia bacterium]
MKNIAIHIARGAATLAVWLVRKTWPSAKHGWSRGLRKRNSWIYIVAALLLFPYLTFYAFSYSWQYGISFIATGVVAVYYGYIFANPGMLVVAFVGVVLGAEATKLLFAAKNIALGGEILPALILVVVAVLLAVKAQTLKTGAIVEDSTATAKRRRRRPSARK